MHKALEGQSSCYPDFIAKFPKKGLIFGKESTGIGGSKGGQGETV